MEVASSKPTASLAIRAMKLPFQGLWFLVKHPIVAIIMLLLFVFSSFSFLAHFSPAIAERFNNATGYFIGATLASQGSDALRSRIAALDADVKTKKTTIARKNKALTKSATALGEAADAIKARDVAITGKNEALRKSAAALRGGADSIRARNATITSKNKALRNAAKALAGARAALAQRGDIIRKQKSQLDGHNSRLNAFQKRGIELETIAGKRFGKVAIYNTAGEFLGWVPIVGDAASLGFAAAGIYEMCQMFNEIEKATTELGVPYQVYTDTFCEKPVEKTKEIIAEQTGAVKGKIIATTTVFKDYATNIPLPDRAAFSANVKSILDRAYTRIGALVNGN